MDGSQAPPPVLTLAEKRNELRLLDNIAADLESEGITACRKAYAARRKANQLRAQVFEPGNVTNYPLMTPAWSVKS